MKSDVQNAGAMFLIANSSQLTPAKSEKKLQCEPRNVQGTRVERFEGIWTLLNHTKRRQGYHLDALKCLLQKSKKTLLKNVFDLGLNYQIKHRIKLKPIAQRFRRTYRNMSCDKKSHENNRGSHIKLWECRIKNQNKCWSPT